MARLHWFWRAAIAVLGSVVIVQSLRIGMFLLQVRLRGLMPPRREEYWNTFVNSPGGEPRVMLATYVLPVLVYVALTRWFGPEAARNNETRCRKCGYILRGITEPRCSECGERI